MPRPIRRTKTNTDITIFRKVAPEYYVILQVEVVFVKRCFAMDV